MILDCLALLDPQPMTSSPPPAAQVICVTDGEPTQEPQTRIFEVIMAAKRACLNSQYGGKAVAFMFAQVSIRTT